MLACLLAVAPSIKVDRVYFVVTFPGDTEGPFEIAPRDLVYALPGAVKFNVDGQARTYQGKTYEIVRHVEIRE